MLLEAGASTEPKFDIPISERAKYVFDDTVGELRVSYSYDGGHFIRAGKRLTGIHERRLTRRLGAQERTLDHSIDSLPTPLHLIIGRAGLGFLYLGLDPRRDSLRSAAPPVHLSDDQAVHGVKLLLDHGADLNRSVRGLSRAGYRRSQEEEVDTALTLAVKSELWKVVDLLLNHGINWDVERNKEVLDMFPMFYSMGTYISPGQRFVTTRFQQSLQAPLQLGLLGQLQPEAQTLDNGPSPIQRIVGADGRIKPRISNFELPDNTKLTLEQISIHSMIQGYLRLMDGGAVPIELRSNGKDVPRSASMLMWAVWTGDLTLVRTLLQRGLDPNMVTEHGDTPLLLAVRHGMERFKPADGMDWWGKGNDHSWRQFQWIHSGGSIKDYVPLENGFLTWLDSLYLEIIDLLVKSGADAHKETQWSLIPMETDSSPPGVRARSGTASGGNPIHSGRETYTPIKVAKMLGFLAAEERLSNASDRHQDQP
jgi:hypothetical protein